MGVIYHADVQTDRMNAVKTAIDAGSGPGTLEIGTTAMATLLGTLTLSDPCGTVAGTSPAILTFSAITQDSSADASGTAAAARVKDSTGKIIIDGLTVGTAAADIIFSNVTITAGQPIPITSAQIAHNISGV